MGSLIEVRVRDCACPATPHSEVGDIVYIRPKIGLEGGIAAQVDFATTQREIPLTDADRDSEDNPTPQRRLFSQTLQRRWMVTFVRFGAVGWNLVDEKGPVPFDVEELLADYDLAYTVADRADDLYAEAVMRPLLPPPSKTSTSGPNVVSMSRAKKSTRSQQRSSSPPASDGTPSQARAG
jgi:hypothetical protein